MFRVHLDGYDFMPYLTGEAEACMRYPPAAQRPQQIDTGTSHIGFRCVIRDRPGAGPP
jgi:hypothetical protein